MDAGDLSFIFGSSFMLKGCYTDMVDGEGVFETYLANEQI